MKGVGETPFRPPPPFWCVSGATFDPVALTSVMGADCGVMGFWGGSVASGSSEGYTTASDLSGGACSSSRILNGGLNKWGSMGLVYSSGGDYALFESESDFELSSLEESWGAL